MTPILFAEIDLVQIIIVVIAMLGGFVQWLWNVFQQAKADAERRRQAPPSAEERARRDEAWKRQVMIDKPMRPAPTVTPPPLQDPFSSVREIFDQVKRELAEAQKPSTQPAPRPQRQPLAKPIPATGADSARDKPPLPSKQARVASDPVTLTTPADLIIPQTRSTSFATVVSSRSENQERTWQALLSNHEALRDAFIVKEILGSPKALQSVSDSS